MCVGVGVCAFLNLTLTRACFSFCFLPHELPRWDLFCNKFPSSAARCGRRGDRGGSLKFWHKQARRSSGRLDQARNARTSPTMWSSFSGQHWAPQAWAQWNAWSVPWQWSHWSGAPNTPANGDGLPTHRRDGPSDHQWNRPDAAATGFLRLPRLLTHGNIGGHMVLNGPACLDNTPILGASSLFL